MYSSPYSRKVLHVVAFPRVPVLAFCLFPIRESLFRPPTPLLWLHESSRIVEEPEMPLFPVLKAGVQRAAALCRGLGCPQIPLFPLSPPQAARKTREKGYL